MVDVKLTIHQQFQLLQKLGERPMGQGSRPVAYAPSVRERVAAEQCTPLVMIFPTIKVASVTEFVEDKPNDIPHIGLVRQALHAVSPKGVMRFPLVLYVAGVVVYPRNSQIALSPSVVFHKGKLANHVVARGVRVAKFEFVDVHFIERYGKVLNGLAFKELAFDFRFIDFRDSD